MRKINNEALKYVLLIAVILVLGVGIAYAALSTTLNITFNNLTQNPVTWSVGFQGTTATGEFSGTSATSSSCGSATISPSAVSIADTELSKPGDKCTYTLTVKNTGTISAKLNTITPTAPSGISCTTNSASMVCGNITYKLLTDTTNGTLLSTGGVLPANTPETIYLVAEFTGSSVVSSSIVHSGAKFALYYIQA